MLSKITRRCALTLGAAIVFAAVSHAQPAGPRNQGPGTGPVVAACQNETQQLCEGKEHGGGAIRACLEANRAKLSTDCKNALDSTGPGRRRNLNN
ncbi:MAG: hypothetical protein JSR61_07590 [Proteobacteria bacterium]|nr:hypothetical protein [Pseudomonadota bacterium]